MSRFRRHGLRSLSPSVPLSLPAPVTRAVREASISFTFGRQPQWYFYSLAVTFIYLAMAPVLAIRAADARAIAALPIIGCTAIASFAVSEFLEVRSQVGYVAFGVNVVAAALADAVFPWFIGAAGSAVISLVIASAGWLSDARARRTRLGTIAVVVAIIAVTTTAAFMGYVRASERLVFLAEKGYELGVKTRLDVQDAQLNLLLAKGNLARAQRDYRVARVTLEWVAGGTP